MIAEPPRDAPSWPSWWGNRWADVLAKLGAGMHRAPPAVRVDAERRRRLVAKIVTNAGRCQALWAEADAKDRSAAAAAEAAVEQNATARGRGKGSRDFLNTF